MENDSNKINENDNALDLFKSMYEKYRNSIMLYLEEYTLEENVKKVISEYYKTLLDYNCIGGKNIRGILVVLIYEYVKNRDINTIEWEKVACLAWCIEILQASFLVADDIMDNAETRRNKYCWYLLKDVETKNAINDVLFLYNCVFKLMEIYLKNDKCYIDIINTFRDVSLKTIIGQHLDTNIFSSKFSREKNESIIDLNDINISEENKIILNMINMKVYNNIVVHKTAYYTFYLPIVCGMLLAGIELNNLIYTKIENISILMGELFQAHDDYIDLYGKSEINGKKGTDIQNKKLTWLLIKVFEICSEEDKMKIIKNYGKNNFSNIKIVKAIYEKNKIKSYYKEYEKTQKEKIVKHIDNLHHEGIEHVLKHILEIMFNDA